MDFRYSAAADAPRTDCLVLPLPEGDAALRVIAALPPAVRSQVERARKDGDFTGKLGTTQLLLLGADGEAPAPRVLLVGTGKNEASDKALKKIIGAVYSGLKGTTAASAQLDLAHLPGALAAQPLAERVVRFGEDALYRMDQCKGEAAQAKITPPKLSSLILTGAAAEAAAIERGIAQGKATAAGIKLAKDLANLPGNLCTPTYLAETAEQLAAELPIATRILEQSDMEALGMGALLSVAKGSRQPPKFIIMEYRNGPDDAKPIALVGKGLTFDAGGISIKPAGKMDEMKFDMCGGATVFGAIKAAALLKLPINLVGLVPASENLPDGAANKPGDIVTSMAGITIEVLNTDAEGRLILCDALTYAEKFHAPEMCIDFATLTGACVVALGHPASGLFSNDDPLAEALLKAGTDTADRAWRLPLWEEYDDQLFSDFADIPNIATRGAGEAGAIVAAMFLQRFAKNMRWAHLDIAASSWVGKKATGRPVAMVTQFLVDQAAK